MCNSNSTHFSTVATAAAAKSYDTAILVVSGLFLTLFAAAVCALAVVYGIERAPFDPVLFMSRG
jgi:hypothetical protein